MQKKIPSVVSPKEMNENLKLIKVSKVKRIAKKIQITKIATRSSLLGLNCLFKGIAR